MPRLLLKGKVDELRKSIGPITQKEEMELSKRRTRLSELFPGKKAPELQSLLKERGVPHSGLSKGELVETLHDALRKGKEKEPRLDQDQRVVLKRGLKETVLVIRAGPGSGKTTTLAALVQRILNKRPESRVLVLSFTRTAKREMTAKLRKRHVQLLQQKKALSAEKPSGCLVTTFDLYGFWAVGLPENTNMMSLDEGVCLRQSAGLLKMVEPSESARQWDWIVVDEAHDLSDIHGKIVTMLRGEPARPTDDDDDNDDDDEEEEEEEVVTRDKNRSTHLVVAGDPCQRVYLGKSWFSGLMKGKTRGKDLVVLKYNYRSSPQIVHALNRFRQKNLSSPKGSHTQIAKRKNTGTVETCRVSSAKRCADEIAKRIGESSPEDVFVVSPVTVNACNEDLTQLIQQVPSQTQPKSLGLVFSKSCATAVPLADLNCYITSTSRALRGIERSRVVLYGITQSFADQGISSPLLKRLLYVAMSRAKDHLHVIAEGKLPKGNPLNCFHFSKLDTKKSVKKPVPVCMPAKVIKVATLAKDDYRHLRQRSDAGQFQMPTSSGEENLPIKLHRSDKVAGIVKGVNLIADLETVTSLPRKELVRMARAKLALEFAQHLKTSLTYKTMSLPSESTQTYFAPPEPTQTYFAVDIETDGFPMISALTEIGAVAFTTSGSVRGTYHKVLRGVTALSDFEDEPESTSSESSSESDESEEEQGRRWLSQPTPYLPEDQNSNDEEESAAEPFSHPVSYPSTMRGVGLQNREIMDMPRESITGIHTPSSQQGASYHERLTTGSAQLQHTRDHEPLGHYATRSHILPEYENASLPMMPSSTVANQVRRWEEARRTCNNMSQQLYLESDPVSVLADQKDADSNQDFSHAFAENMTGLRVTDTNTLHTTTNKALKRFHRWVKCISDRPCFIHWTGTASTALQLDASYDVGMLFRAWLVATDMKRSKGLALTDCVRQVLGPQFPYQPHRAFEDSVATAAVFLALTQGNDQQ